MEGPTPWSRKDQVHRRFRWGQRRVQGRHPCRHREVARTGVGVLGPHEFWDLFEFWGLFHSTLSF